jgi:hypothetical protein
VINSLLTTYFVKVYRYQTRRQRLKTGVTPATALPPPIAQIKLPPQEDTRRYGAYAKDMPRQLGDRSTL